MEELRQPHIDGGEAYLGAECLEPFANEKIKDQNTLNN